MSGAATSRVAIVGGGLAGLAAAVRLAEHGLSVEVFEARKALGGRAASYRDPVSGELIDHCQHVAMACCTNFHDFCARSGIADEFDRYDTLHFIGPDSKRSDLRASRWLPAPLHLATSLLRQGYLSWRERVRIGVALVQLARTNPAAVHGSIGDWLLIHGQSENAIARFWSVVLVSALGETVERAAFAPARKVFVDGFMGHREGYQIDVPRRSLRQLFNERVAQELERRGVIIHRNAPVEVVAESADRLSGIRLSSGAELPFDDVILALPWRRVFALVPPVWQTTLAALDVGEAIGASPITGVHLWFDRPLTALPHAVLVDRLSQWVFRREGAGDHYYQVVISASRDVSQIPQPEFVAAVVAELQATFPAGAQAKLLSSKVVTEREAVFSYGVDTDELRPSQVTAVPHLFGAGDWTQTGWPSTLESAVRSGYLAAEGVLAGYGQSTPLLAADLPRGWLARMLIARP
jgi:squalene-associated FAD-dependent desaturase